jgi:hypothetical protein
MEIRLFSFMGIYSGGLTWDVALWTPAGPVLQIGTPSASGSFFHRDSMGFLDKVLDGL